MSLYVFVEPSRVITGVEAFTTKFVTVPLVESLNAIVCSDVPLSVRIIVPVYVATAPACTVV